ncbi:phosphotransferase family protein [Mycolicibacterium pallens]|uniref:Ecdysteroid 22-kinase family protein n=1 Tax=Mycolicibacterium pallens TaxID=370524 RepID=A0ABX8VCI1_9MYCO|nr:phosphotransferase [Mycolicibacterium pallens]APE14343.1 phosphotransferase [Mycobacterium sp. WY10]QYL15192.1 ecdysteroid 22-kinase family protein [Mycolicibacterium pallens]
MRSVVRFGAHVGRGVRRLALDGAQGRRRSFPRRIADLTPTELSAIIGCRVDSVDVLDGVTGTSSRARLGITGDDVPASVFVKMSAESAGIRMLGELAGLGETEVRFYRELAPELGVGIPRSYGAAFDSLTGRFVIVLEDMSTSPCQFPDTLHPLSTDQMAQVVDVLAELHATFWGRLPQKSGGSGQFGWLIAPSEDPANLLTPTVMRTSARRLAGSTSIPVLAGRYIWENFAAVTAVVDSGPHTVLHGDSHPGNTFFRNGHGGLLDWQVVRRGHPSRDLAYAIVLGTPVGERAGVERDLIDTYRTALAARGGPRLDRDDLWTRYRQAVVHPYLSALATAGLGGMQEEGIALEGLRRAVTALEDLETVTALQRAR